MDEMGKVGRKYPSPEAMKTANALYKRRGSQGPGAGNAERGNLEHAASILEELVAVYGRTVKATVFQGELVFSDEGVELARAPSSRAISMVEDIRLILSPILDRKA